MLKISSPGSTFSPQIQGVASIGRGDNPKTNGVVLLVSPGIIASKCQATHVSDIAVIDQSTTKQLDYVILCKTDDLRKSPEKYIYDLPSYSLNEAIPITIEYKDDEFIVTAPNVSPDLPVFGSADSEEEAIEMFRNCLEYFYNDMIENESWGNQWKSIRDYLENRIRHNECSI